ncbi:hypothetical protein H9635_09970 [Solibacillus sp. A46]|uniref:Uncharacterized protein n=1 Tax=Solibacillus faecavium TaxID=2762221 RepID=A0ABR8XYN5_9BACL|nr:hypothetical protein [Solibacillus faecavium]MBD8037071.1 hypothetical protein [Solibacillus faecavium]
MSKNEFIKMLDEKINEYEKLIQTTEKDGLLKSNTSKTYLLHSMNFVRWCKGEFIPGDKNKCK